MKNTVANLIKNPRITEKASMLYEGNVYAFDILPKANKTEISKAIFEIYKVKPKKIAVVTIKPKKVLSKRTGVRGVKAGGKKAYVYLNKGDKINIV